MRTKRMMVVGAAVVALMGSACSSSTDEKAEPKTEEAGPTTTGEKAEPKTEEAGPTTTGEKAETTTGENTEPVFTTGSLPAGWPSELAPPPGSKDFSPMSEDGELTISFGLDGDVNEVAKDLSSQLKSAGYKIKSEDGYEAGAGTVASITAVGSDYEVDILVTERSQSDRGNVLVNWTLIETGG